MHRSSLNTGMVSTVKALCGRDQIGEVKVGESKSILISFGDEFAVAPNVCACLMGQGHYLGVNVQVVSVTNSGCTLKVNNNGKMTYAPVISWLAIFTENYN